MATKKPSLYLISILLFMLILPIISIAFEWGTLPAWPLIGKWFVFWAIGIRLFIAGARQITKPEFTAKDIFHIDSQESLVIVRELGFANLSIGLAGMLSLLKPGWTEIAAITGGLFFGLAGLLHVQKKRGSTNEVIAMISDLFIFLVIVLYLLFTSIM